jgi:hypothetical protein
MDSLETVQDLILRSCRHVERMRSETEMRDGAGTILTCCACWNRSVAARRQARKAQLACRPNDCDRCGKRPHTYTYAQYRLCGRCLAATRREHNQAMARAGSLAIFDIGLMMDTKTWAAGR